MTQRGTPVCVVLLRLKNPELSMLPVQEEDDDPWIEFQHSHQQFRGFFVPPRSYLAELLSFQLAGEGPATTPSAGCRGPSAFPPPPDLPPDLQWTLAVLTVPCSISSSNPPHCTGRTGPQLGQTMRLG